MESLKRLIDKAACGRSRADVARSLNCSPQRLWQWESGHRSVPDAIVAALATRAGVDAAKAIGEVRLERAKKKAPAGALGVLLACAISVGGSARPSDAHAVGISPRSGVDTSHILGSLDRWLRGVQAMLGVYSCVLRGLNKCP